MSAPFLSDEELTQVCRGVTQNAARIRHLKRMGIPYRVRPDGSPLVWRWDSEKQQAPGKGPKWSRAAA